MIGNSGIQNRIRFRAALMMCAPVWVAGGMTSAHAAAAQGVDQVETIVVTAEKRSESLQNVPLSIVAVSGDQLQASGVKNATQLGKIVPDLRDRVYAKLQRLSFRFFDVLKPPPIRQADARLKGGLGVMFDDILAAFYTLLAMAVCKAALG